MPSLDPMFGGADPFVRVGWEAPRRAFRLLLTPVRRACLDVVRRVSLPAAVLAGAGFVSLVLRGSRGWSGWALGVVGGLFAALLVAAALAAFADGVARRGVERLFRAHGRDDVAWRRGVVRAIETFAVPTAPDRQAVLWRIDGDGTRVQVGVDFLLYDTGDPVPTVVEMRDAILVEPGGGDPVASIPDAAWAWLRGQNGGDFLDERDAPALQVVVGPGDEIEILGRPGRIPSAHGDDRRPRQLPTGPSLAGARDRPLLLRRVRG